jgi:hypothetical protein
LVSYEVQLEINGDIMWACMVIDLKVLVKRFSCEDSYVGNPRKSFFEFAKVTFLFAKVSRKLDVIVIIVYSF